MMIGCGGFAGCLCGRFFSRSPTQKNKEPGLGPTLCKIVSLTPLPHILESARGY